MIRVNNRPFWYNLKLGETYGMSDSISVTRVPGGWVYSTHNSCTFIPFDTEFIGGD